MTAIEDRKLAGTAARGAMLPAVPADLPAHLSYYGPTPVPSTLPAGALADLIGRAGLRGRGGAGFLVYRKLQSVAEAARTRAATPVVIANGCEGEPASGKDKHLLRTSPHLVIDGLLLLARELGAKRAVLAVEAGVHDGRGDLVHGLRAALAERFDARQIKLHETGPRFISGESGALVSALDGGPGLPFFAQTSVRERGLGGAPTLVQNVETVALIGLIARYGPNWLRAFGTVDDPGPTLLTVRPARAAAYVVEAEAGAPIWPLLTATSDEPVSAVLVGGYHGTWIPASAALRRARLTETELGGPLGAGVLAALPADRCGLAETARVMRYLALESAGQCGPCLNALPRIASALERLADPSVAPREPGLAGQIRHWSGLAEGRGLCHHPDGSTRFVRSALTTFAAELSAHRAGVCTASDARPVLPTPARSHHR